MYGVVSQGIRQQLKALPRLGAYACSNALIEQMPEAAHSIADADAARRDWNILLTGPLREGLIDTARP